MAPGLPLGFYQLTTPDGLYLPLLVQSLGYAFATTSYRQNGLAILEGVADVQELVTAFGDVVLAADAHPHCRCLGGWAGGDASR